MWTYLTSEEVRWARRDLLRSASLCPLLDNKGSCLLPKLSRSKNSSQWLRPPLREGRITQQTRMTLSSWRSTKPPTSSSSAYRCPKQPLASSKRSSRGKSRSKSASSSILLNRANSFKPPASVMPLKTTNLPNSYTSAPSS
jgi:hypothetical protein